MDLVSLLITLLIVGVILAILYWFLGQLPLPPPFRMAINAILALIVIIWLLSILFGYGHMPVIRLR